MQYHEYLNLERYRDTLGDPSKYFVDNHDLAPRVVEHFTGEPHWIIDTFGVLRPIKDWYAGRIAASDLPRTESLGHFYYFGPPQGPDPSPEATLHALPGEFKMGGVVTPPSATPLG